MQVNLPVCNGKERNRQAQQMHSKSHSLKGRWMGCQGEIPKLPKKIVLLLLVLREPSYRDESLALGKCYNMFKKILFPKDTMSDLRNATKDKFLEWKLESVEWREYQYYKSSCLWGSWKKKRMYREEDLDLGISNVKGL